MTVTGGTTAADAPGDRPDVVARPPLLYLGFLLAGLGLEVLWPGPAVHSGLRYGLGGALAVAGFALMLVAVGLFRRSGTNVQTWKPTTALVCHGIYRFSRNPIYVGMTGFYAGIALLAGSLWALGLVVPLLLVVHHGVIAREERYLEDKFGDAYRLYRAAPRRWL